jgi:type IV pilus assembly protein PilW
MRRRVRCGARKVMSCAGVTLIEMMVSMTIGLIIVAAVGYVYLASTANFRGQDALSRMQENARAVFEVMTRDIRMAGFTGCSSGDSYNVLVNANEAYGNANFRWYKNMVSPLIAKPALPLMGYEKPDGGTWGAFPAGVTGVEGKVKAYSGDVLSVLHADNTREFIVKKHEPSLAPPRITLTANHDIKQNEFLVIADADCSKVAVFQNTKSCTINPVTNGCDHAIIEHDAAAPCTSGNFRKKFGSTTAAAGSCPDGDAAAVIGFNPNSRVYRITNSTFYIRNNPEGEPALFRQTVEQDNGLDNPTNALELVEGVEKMELQYGIDTNADGAVDKYVDADDAGLASAEDWRNKVLAVRISLLLVSSVDEKDITAEKQTYRFKGQTIVATDRKLRKAFTTTIAIKNRLS